MKLKHIRYFGKFYEFEGQLGWMPYHKVLYTYFAGYPMNWVSQKDVKFK